MAPPSADGSFQSERTARLLLSSRRHEPLQQAQFIVYADFPVLQVQRSLRLPFWIGDLYNGHSDLLTQGLAMLTDTDPDMRRRQIELTRQLTPAEKIAQVRQMTDCVVRLSRRAIARANPDLSREEVDLRWVEINYGSKLAGELRAYLEDRETCNPSTP
jgi:hypothetical protein